MDRNVPSLFLIGGMLMGFGLFSLCYWWTGTITFSATIGLIVSGGVMVAKQFQNRFSKKGEQK